MNYVGTPWHGTDDELLAKVNELINMNHLCSAGYLGRRNPLERVWRKNGTGERPGTLAPRPRRNAQPTPGKRVVGSGVTARRDGNA